MTIMKNRMGIALLVCMSLLLFSLPAVAETTAAGSSGEDLNAAYHAYLAEQARADALERLEAATSVEQRLAILDESSDLLEFGTQTTSELVLYPLTPCRIVDTRFATRWGSGTPIPDGGTISLWTYGSRTDQGGINPSSCGVNGDAAAVVINVTVIPVSGGSSFLTVWPYGSAQPNASLVNSDSNSVVDATANAVVQTQCRACSNELSIYSLKQAHVVVDVIGYFGRPTATAVDNNVLNTQTIVANNTSANIFSPVCPAGWRLTGGGYVLPYFSDVDMIVGCRPVQGTSSGFVSGINLADRYLCQVTNNTGGSRTVTCYSVCARIPGR